ncbi:nuclear protein set [Leptolyngbya sp. Heron Island J]|uniref:SET domain-containing protein-lysine N-methyltransferase n=1 Tax=Leptolyngbya sp. Heron Island J TaxID=1385935 RepID=UPI0003B94325|nr:SET domain-containing protein-lysine N-methyltransferase [Leptolyngbya sp. Heron Island J]ESA32708.1 nuclear protein set [Leptolyngbya sp. Heron Island J]
MRIQPRKSLIKIESRDWLTNAVIATDTIKARTVIYQSQEFLILPKPNYQTVQIADNAHIIDHVFANLNHHCSPNTFIDVSDFSLVAERDIEQGEELTFAYFTTEVKLDRPFYCQCNSSNCIGNILGASQMPFKSLMSYSLSHHVLNLTKFASSERYQAYELGPQH